MPDLERIKSNVAKMASMKAPVEDIDGYIASEGISIDDVRKFQPSVSTEGASFLTQHPLKSALQGLPETLTGKTMEQRAVESTQSPDYMKANGVLPYKGGGLDRNLYKVKQGAMSDIVGGQIIDQGTAPINYIGGKLIEPAMKALGLPLESISNVVKFSKPKAQADLAESVQNTLMSQKRSVIDKYGKEYSDIVGNSDKSINLNVPIKNFVDESQSLMQNPEFSQQIAAKNPQANRIMDMVQKVTEAKVPDEISAKEADKLSRYIKNLPSIKTKLNQGSKYGFHTVQWTNEDRMLIGLADDIKGSVIEAHPELADLNKEYGNFMNSYKKIAPDFKIGSTIKNLKNYSQMDPQKRLMFENIMPRDTVDKIKSFDMADKTASLLKKIGIGAATAAGMGSVGKEAWELTGH